MFDREDAPTQSLLDSLTRAEAQPTQAGLKTTYRHTECGQQTTVPSQIAESIQGGAAPEGDVLFCVGCMRQVPTGTLFWVELDGSAGEVLAPQPAA